MITGIRVFPRCDTDKRLGGVSGAEAVMQAASPGVGAKPAAEPIRHSDVMRVGGSIGADGGGNGTKYPTLASVSHPAATPTSGRRQRVARTLHTDAHRGMSLAHTRVCVAYARTRRVGTYCGEVQQLVRDAPMGSGQTRYRRMRRLTALSVPATGICNLFAVSNLCALLRARGQRPSKEGVSHDGYD